jgi:hypothetical protein
VVSNPPAELLPEVELAVPVALALLDLAVAGFMSPTLATGLSVFNIVGMV